MSKVKVLVGIILAVVMALLLSGSEAISATHPSKSDMVLSKTMNLSKDYEGFRAHPYRCSEGHLTIGYGTLIKKNTPRKVTKAQASRMLMNELLVQEKELDRVLPWWRTLNTDRQVALLLLANNLGVAKLLKFKTMLTALKQGKYKLAARSLLYVYRGGAWHKTRYHQQVKLRAVHTAYALYAGIYSTSIKSSRFVLA